MSERHSGYQPPFQLSHGMAAHIADIAELLGTWKAANPGALKPELRRGHRLRTLHASLAIEQNTLTLEQVTAVLDGRIVLGTPRDQHGLPVVWSWKRGKLTVDPLEEGTYEPTEASFAFLIPILKYPNKAAYTR